MSPPAGNIKNVIYKSHSLLSCNCGNEILVCVDPSLTYNCAPYIEATLNSVVCGRDSCGRRLYSYYISYNANWLLNPTYSLLSLDIQGVVCRGCLTKYIDWKAPFFKASCDCDYTYILPCCPPVPGDSLIVQTVNGTEIYLTWSSCTGS